MIDLIIDDQESVVRFVKRLNVDGGILGIVLVDVQLELRRNLLGVDRSFHRGAIGRLPIEVSQILRQLICLEALPRGPS